MTLGAGGRRATNDSDRTVPRTDSAAAAVPRPDPTTAAAVDLARVLIFGDFFLDFYFCVRTI